MCYGGRQRMCCGSTIVLPQHIFYNSVQRRQRQQSEAAEQRKGRLSRRHRERNASLQRTAAEREEISCMLQRRRETRTAKKQKQELQKQKQGLRK